MSPYSDLTFYRHSKTFPMVEEPFGLVHPRLHRMIVQVGEERVPRGAGERRGLLQDVVARRDRGRQTAGGGRGRSFAPSCHSTILRPRRSGHWGRQGDTKLGYAASGGAEATPNSNSRPREVPRRHQTRMRGLGRCRGDTKLGCAASGSAAAPPNMDARPRVAPCDQTRARRISSRPRGSAQPGSCLEYSPARMRLVTSRPNAIRRRRSASGSAGAGIRATVLLQ